MSRRDKLVFNGTMTLPPEEFARALESLSTQLVKPMFQDIVAETAIEAHEEIGKGTPVLTGYCRASLGAGSSNGTTFLALPPRNPKQSYVNRIPTADAMAMEGIQAAVEESKPIIIGFSAPHAPYVEDKYHMIKTVRGRMTQILQVALARVKAGWS